jgi:hypothetical protein
MNKIKSGIKINFENLKVCGWRNILQEYTDYEIWKQLDEHRLLYFKDSGMVYLLYRFSG